MDSESSARMVDIGEAGFTAGGVCQLRVSVLPMYFAIKADRRSHVLFLRR